MIDSVRSVETPEGVMLDLRLAGPLARCLAWAIDMSIKLAIYMILGMTMPFLGAVGTAVFLISMFLVEWFYPVVFEVFLKGQTVGKMALGIRVLCDDGTPVGWYPSTIRNFLRVVDFLPLLNGAGLVCMLVQRDFKRLGDLAAGTLVVYAERRAPRHASKVSADTDEKEEAATLPSIPLNLEEQQAIVAFSHRARELTPERSEELSDLLEAVTEAKGREGVNRLRQWASIYAGER